MAYKRFEDLPVWGAAIELAARTFEMSATGGLDAYAGLRSQIERAVVSVSNNIAEGFERGTHEELLTFLYYALGSAGEVRSMVLLARRLPGNEPLQSHLDELLPMSRGVSRQLNAWIESLKNSTSRGPRYQNDSTRGAQETARRAEAFLKKLDVIKNRPRSEFDPEPES
jgi:four helix bundle protein